MAPWALEGVSGGVLGGDACDDDVWGYWMVLGRCWGEVGRGW